MFLFKKSLTYTRSICCGFRQRRNSRSGRFRKLSFGKITFNAIALGNSKLDLYNTDLWDSMSNPITHSVVDGEVTIYPCIACSDFVLKVLQVQCEISRESGVTYFKLPTWSLFGPNTPVYDHARQAVWMTSTNITYGDLGGAIEKFNGIMIMLNVN